MYNALTVVLHPVIDAIAKCISFCKRTLFIRDCREYYLDKIYYLYQECKYGHHICCPKCNAVLTKMYHEYTHHDACRYIKRSCSKTLIKSFYNDLLLGSKVNVKFKCTGCSFGCYGDKIKEEVVCKREPNVIYRPDKLTGGGLW